MVQPLCFYNVFKIEHDSLSKVSQKVYLQIQYAVTDLVITKFRENHKKYDILEYKKTNICCEYNLPKFQIQNSQPSQKITSLHASITDHRDCLQINKILINKTSTVCMQLRLTTGTDIVVTALEKTTVGDSTEADGLKSGD